MKHILKKLILLGLFVLCLSTLLLTWVNHKNIQTLNGTSVLTGNLMLSGMIVASYIVSVLFFEKAPKVFFPVGLMSLSMLFAIMFAKFESLGRFANGCSGPYCGILSVILTVVVYDYLFGKMGDKE